MIAIAGENGAGKTMLEKLSPGFILPSERLMENGRIVEMGNFKQPRCIGTAGL